MPIITRPDSDQLLFRSSKTGDSVLDTYLEAAEVGGRSLAALMGDIFDAGTGKIRSGLVQFRLNAATRELESRSGDYTDPDAGYAGTGAFFSRFRGDWASGVQYRSSDYIRISGVTYLVTADHLSGASPDFTKLLDILNNPLLSAIGSLTGAANKLPYFTGSNTAATTDLSAFARTLLAASSDASVRSLLGLGVGATMALSAVPQMTMAGALTLAADPLTGLQAATKAYVDAQISSRAAPLGYTPVNRAGDSLSGFLTAHADPTSPLHVATKQYVDAQILAPVSGKVNKSGDTMSGNLTIQAALAVRDTIYQGSFPVWHQGNFNPSNYAPILNPVFGSAVGGIAALRVSPSPGCSAIGVVSDIGQAFSNWNAAGSMSALDLSAPNNANAYQVWRVARDTVRTLAGMSVYSGGGDGTPPLIRFQMDGNSNAFEITPTGARAAGQTIWHTGNFDPNLYLGVGATAQRANRLSMNGDPNAQAMTFNWSGQPGQPPWVWGGSDGVNHYVYNPSNFSVARAGTSAAVDHSPNRTDSTQYPVLWGTPTGTTAAFSCAGIRIRSSDSSLIVDGLVYGNLRGTADAASSVTNGASNGYGARTVSSSAPSGGNDGDVWYQV